MGKYISTATRFCMHFKNIQLCDFICPFADFANGALRFLFFFIFNKSKITPKTKVKNEKEAKKIRKTRSS